VARKRDPEVLIALNPETAKQDALDLPTGGVAIYEENLNLKQYRDDVVFLSGAAGQDYRGHLSRGQAAQAGQEHGVCGRGPPSCFRST